MAENDDNLVLRLLRDIRDKLDQHDHRFDELGERMGGFERHAEEMKESVAYALGLSAHANVAYETTGQRLDRLTERLSGLEARVKHLEADR